MGGLSLDRLRQVLRDIANDGRVYHAQTMIDAADGHLVTLATDDLYAIVSVNPSAVPGRSLIDVHAGGAYDVHINGQVLEILATSSWRFDYGGLWCRTTPAPGMQT